MPVLPSFSYYAAGVDVEWANQIGNPIKIVKMVFTNGGSTREIQRNIPSFLSLSESAYLDAPENWLDRSTFLVSFLRAAFGPIPTSVDVSVIDYNGKESAATTMAVTDVGTLAAIFNSAGDTIYDDGDFDRLEVGIDAVETQINVYNQNVPANRTHSNPWSALDVITIGSEQIRLDVVDDAANGLYTVTRGFNGTTAVAHSAGEVARR